MKKTVGFWLGLGALCFWPMWALSGEAGGKEAVEEPVFHWFEAEDFPTNGSIGTSDQASGSRYTEGGSWYFLANAIPFPSAHDAYDVWVRVWSDVPAGWFIQNREAKEVKGQFKTDQAETWTWVRAGRYRPDEVGEAFWGIYIGRPLDSAVASARGRLDAVVIGRSVDEVALERWLAQRLERARSEDPQSARAEALRNARRVAYVPWVKGKPVIDGDLESDFWDQASVADDFVLLRGSGMAGEQTAVHLAAGEDALYIGAVLYESQMPFIHQVKTVDGDNVWTDDTFELFIDPDRTDREAHHFIVNPIGTVQDNLHRLLDRADGARQQATPWQSAVTRKNDRWIVEIALPWEVLGSSRPESGQAWTVNFARAERPAGELSYWNNTGSYFYQPNRYGLMVFGRYPVEVSTVSFDEISRTLGFEVLSRQDGIGAAALTFELESHQKPLRQEQRELVWRTPGEAARASFSLEDLQPDRYHAQVRVGYGQNAGHAIDLPLTLYSDSLVSAAWPPEMRENVLHLAAGTVQHCFFVLGNHSANAVDSVELVVDVPAWLRMLDPRDGLLVRPDRYYGVTHWTEEALTIEDQSYRRYRLGLDRAVPVGHLESSRFYDAVLVFLEQHSDESVPAEGESQVFYRLKSPLGEEQAQAFLVRVLPPLEGRQPQELVVHNWLWTLSTNQATWAPLIKTLRQAGFNYVDAVSGSLGSDYIDVVREAGMRTVNNMYWYWWYPAHASKYPDHVAINYEGKPVQDRKICPTRMMASDGQLAREALAPVVERTRAGLADGVVWNLEGPAVWDVCFCPLCLEAFREFAGLDAQTPLTARKVRAEHSRAWIDFACRQNETMIRILREEMEAVHPGAWVSIYSGNPNPATKESYRVDWERAARHLSATFMSYYSHSPASLNQTFDGGMRQMIHQVRTWAGETSFRAIATLTPGYVRNNFLQPSADLMAMQVIRSLASGADGVSFWWWGPFDGLYYTALAQATRTVAGVESFFLDGTPEESLRQKVQRPEQNASVAVFRYDNRLLVLLMNHDPKEVGRFDLSNLLRDHPRYEMTAMPEERKSDSLSWDIAPLKWQALVLEPVQNE